MALIKLAAASAIGYALYKMVVRQDEPALAGANGGRSAPAAPAETATPNTQPSTNGAQGGPYVSPI